MVILKTINLIKRFGGLAAVNGVDLSINENEILGVIGPNGAGKTTFVNLISGLIYPTQVRNNFWRYKHRKQTGNMLELRLV